MNISVTAESRGTDLWVRVNVLPANPYTQYAYYLYDLKRKTIQKQMYTDHAQTRFSALEPGRYYVKVFVRTKEAKDAPYFKTTKNSEVLYVADPNRAEELHSFLSGERAAPTIKLPFVKAKAPKQDILLARTGSAQAPLLCRLAEELQLHHYLVADAAAGSTVVLTGLPLFAHGNRFAAFSGIGRTADRLILGMQDVDGISTADALSGQVGNFWLLRGTKTGVTLETDYFGVDKLYYYSSNGVFLASNRIHLLLLALKRLQRPRFPNYEKIYASLPLNNQQYMQNFSPEMDIKGILVLPVDSRIRLYPEKNHVEIEKTPLYHALSTPENFDEARYQNLLHKAADELVDNLRVALEHPAFDKFVVHVTGGLDSRLVYCAVSRLPEYRDRFIALTGGSPSQSADFQIAMKVISKYPVAMGPIPLCSEEPDEENQHLFALSMILGTTSNYLVRGKQARYDHVCVLPGYFGEIVARAYYSRGKFETGWSDTTQSDDVFMNYLFEAHHSQAIFTLDDNLERVMAKAYAALPGRTNLEKLENHYLYYRNGLHFHISHPDPISQSWGILQSKSLMQLKYMTFPMNYGTRLQNDLMYLLNPAIASVSYAGEPDQNERQELHRLYGKYPEADNYDDALIDRLVDQWKANQKHLQSKINRAADAATFIEREELLNILHYLYRTIGLDQRAVAAMYYYICDERESETKTRFIRKLYMLYFELTV